LKYDSLVEAYKNGKALNKTDTTQFKELRGLENDKGTTQLFGWKFAMIGSWKPRGGGLLIEVHSEYNCSVALVERVITAPGRNPQLECTGLKLTGFIT
jgi:hypothetical protein